MPLCSFRPKTYGFAENYEEKIKAPQKQSLRQRSRTQLESNFLPSKKVSAVSRSNWLRGPRTFRKKNNAEIFENFCWWLQRCTEVHCNYKGAQSFLRVISRHYDISAEPFVAWEIAKFREFKKAFNDLALLAPRVNLAFDRKVAAYLLKTLAKDKKLNDKTLHNAMLLYLVTSLRAGNVLLGSGDSDKTLTLKMGNVFEQKGSANSVPCMFIL